MCQLLPVSSVAFPAEVAWSALTLKTVFGLVKPVLDHHGNNALGAFDNRNTIGVIVALGRMTPWAREAIRCGWTVS